MPRPASPRRRRCTTGTAGRPSLPAYVVASFVGLSRVEARKHRVGDVLVGAAIGTATGHLITTKADDRVRIFPWGDTNSAGVDVTLRF
ncbi:phosphatase PAP2 family protein [Sphingopyxis sp. PET50]|uniref:phosphatase PAP2 family protein n=1 Tax=Sphingopyxis sp. PET50 TaxID=2976533 RepID=UPI00391B8823